jgi:hypothetical protein
MARKTPGPLVRAVTDVMWNRDQLQMCVVDALLSGADSTPLKRPRPKARRRAAKKR